MTTGRGTWGYTSDAAGLRTVALGFVLLGLTALCGCSSSAPTTASPTTQAPPTSDGRPASSTTSSTTSSPRLDRVTVTCSERLASVSTTEVHPQADGVHLLIHNTSTAPVEINDGRGGESAPPGDSELVIARLPPGPMSLSCGYDLNDLMVPARTVQITDPDHVFIPMGIDCATMRLVDWAEGPPPSETPEAAIRWWFSQPRELQVPYATGDTLARVGYVDAAAPVFALRRNGRTIDLFQATHDQDGWSALPDEGCIRP